MLEGEVSWFLFVETHKLNPCWTYNFIHPLQKKHCLLDSSTSVPHLLTRSLFPVVVFVGAQNWRQLQLVVLFVHVFSLVLFWTQFMAQIIRVESQNFRFKDAFAVVHTCNFRGNVRKRKCRWSKLMLQGRNSFRRRLRVPGEGADCERWGTNKGHENVFEWWVGYRT